MKPLTYLGFTIFSVFVQFCVMEIIYDRFQLDQDAISSNETVSKNIIKKINRKPHALFYRTETKHRSFDANNDGQIAKYSNSSLDNIITSTTTDILSTTLEVFYDENTSITDDFLSTESYFTSSEFDNVTEITLLNKSSTTAKPNPGKKAISKEKCFCDLLYKKCDVNCCCDSDCSEEDRSLFINCGKDSCDKLDLKFRFCNSYPVCDNTLSTGLFNDLFCVVKVNLPVKRTKSYYKLDEASINYTFTWNSVTKTNYHTNYKKKKYEYGDPLWLLQNDSISLMYLPTTMVNSYCSSTKPMRFLRNENIKCLVKLHDLYIFEAPKAIEGTKLISVTDSQLNNTVLNCSAMHCTNWTVYVCDDEACEHYNHTVHAPTCTENYCNNLALKYEYTFYYFESRLTNASLKLYMKELSTNMPLLVQEIAVNWYLGKESIENIIQLSGNPGYILGLPVIFSSATNNHTSNFYNSSALVKNLSFPSNEDGNCVWSKVSNKTLVFGLNIRTKCRLKTQQNISNKNATTACRNIQIYIKDSLRLHQKLFVSPYGNPQNLNDDKWIPLEIYDQTFIYGEYCLKESKLNCFNLVTRYAFVVAFADTSDVLNRKENKIVKVTVYATPYNFTFNTADISMVLTVDIKFVDISMRIIEFAKAPNLNIHLPSNFFFDYRSNGGFATGTTGSHKILLYLFSLIILSKK